MTTLVASQTAGFAHVITRGDYVRISDGKRTELVRVIGATPSTIDTRPAGNRWFEAIARRIEDYLLFPLEDGFEALVRWAHA